MVVRELVALMGIKTDKKGFQQAESGMGKLVKVAKVAAVAFASLKVVKFVKGAIEEVAELGDRFDKLSKRTGVSTMMLQKLDHAAQLSGASLGDVETSLRRLQAAQVDADAGLKTYTREFERLGIEIKDANGNFKETPELLIEIADGMQGLESDAERTAVATKLLGRSGTALIPMFKEGSGALRDMMAELDDFGALIGEDMIKASADFVDNQRRVDLILQSVKLTISKEVIPWLNKATDSMIAWWKINGQWVRQDILRPLGKLVIVFGRIFRTIGKVLGVAAKLLAWTAKFIKNMDPFKKKILLLVTAFGVLGKLLLMGPFGKFLLLFGAIFLIVEDFFFFLDGKESLIGKLNDKLKEMFDLDLREAIEGINLFFDNLQAKGQDAEVVWGALWDEMWLVFKDYLSLAGQWWAEFWGDQLPQPVVDFYNFLVGLFETILTIILFPFQQAIKFITDIFEVGFVGALDRLRIQVLDWANSVLDTIQKPFKAVSKWIAKIAGKPFEVATTMDVNEPSVKGFLETVAQGKSTVAGIEAGPQAFGSGLNMGNALAGPIKAKPGTGARPTVVDNKTDVKIDIKGSPGMDEGKLAQEVGRQVGKVLDKQNRAAIQALTPTVSGLPV